MTTLEEEVLAPQHTANAVKVFTPHYERPTESSDSDRQSKSVVDSTTDDLPPPPPALIVNEAYDREQERFRLRRESFISRLFFGR